MINALIVDKDHRSAAMLSYELTQSDVDINLIGHYSLMSEAINSINVQNSDLIFLDVTDRKKDYRRHLKYLKNNNIKVVYLSSTTDLALEAIKEEVSDYILKPIQSAALETTLKKIRKSFICQCDRGIRIKFPYSHGIRYISSNEVLYIRSNGNYTWIYNTTGERFLANFNLKYVEDLLSQRFFARVHNQYIVNLNKVIEYKRGNSDVLLLCNGDAIPLSRLKRKVVLELLDMI